MKYRQTCREKQKANIYDRLLIVVAAAASFVEARYSKSCWIMQVFMAQFQLLDNKFMLNVLLLMPLTIRFMTWLVQMDQ